MSTQSTVPRQNQDLPTSRLQPIEIRVDHLYKSFSDKLALDGINLEIRRGEIVAVVGTSGSGKTTLLRHLTGHFRPDRGKVLLADHDAKNSPLVDIATLTEAGMERIERHWAVVFQQNGLLSGTVYDDIALPLRVVQGLDEATVRDKVNEVILAVGLDTKRDAETSSDQLSGGMAKRVAIARALVVDPILIFYDEPTAALDPSLGWKIQDLIQTVHERPTISGIVRTSLIITHDKDLLQRLRPRVVMLEAGRVIFDDSHDEFQKSNLPATQPYLEMPDMNHASNDPL